MIDVVRALGHGELATYGEIAEEVGRLLRVDDTAVFRYEDGRTVTVVANSTAVGDAPGYGVTIVTIGKSTLGYLSTPSRE